MLFCGTIIYSCLVGIGGFPMEMLYRMLIPICFRKSRMRQRNAAAHSLCMWMMVDKLSFGAPPLLALLLVVLGVTDMKEFWKFTIPQYFIRLLFLTVGAVLIFPMA